MSKGAFSNTELHLYIILIEFFTCYFNVLNLILRMGKKIISILKNAHFSGKGRQLLHI